MTIRTMTATDARTFPQGERVSGRRGPSTAAGTRPPLLLVGNSRRDPISGKGGRMAEREAPSMAIDPRPQADDRDRATITARMAAYDRIDGPRVGDYIRYSDGMVRRIAHVWPADWHDDKVARCQVTDGGSFYQGGAYERQDRPREESGPSNDGAYISYSGALYPGIRANLLTVSADSREGRVWIFHREQWGAGMGVDAFPTFRMYDATIDGRDPWNTPADQYPDLSAIKRVGHHPRR